MQRLRRCAFALVPRLKESHWDNCKVHFNPRGAFSLAHGAIHNGHDAERIVTCYEQALFKTHGHAVDQAASTGQLVFFNLSSTILETRRLLACDGLTREKRIRTWYERRRAMTAEIRAAFEALQRRLGAPESAQAYPIRRSIGVGQHAPATPMKSQPQCPPVKLGQTSGV
jgi:hypothetical protein